MRAGTGSCFGCGHAGGITGPALAFGRAFDFTNGRANGSVDGTDGGDRDNGSSGGAEDGLADDDEEAIDGPAFTGGSGGKGLPEGKTPLALSTV